MRQSPELPPAAARLIRAAARGGATEAFPPVVTAGPDGTVARDPGPHGEAVAHRLGELLAGPAFTPLLDLLERLESWCGSLAPELSGLCAGALPELSGLCTGALSGHPAAPSTAPPATVPSPVAPSSTASSGGLLSTQNTALFGPLVLEVFTACATAPADTARRFATERGAQFQRALGLFLRRLHRDLRGPDWPEGPRWRGTLVALSAYGEETHNGGQRVLRARFSGGGSVAYKPRPASGEALFLATEGSVFALLNALPAASGEILLPTLRCWTGNGGDRHAYSWQEWIEPPPQAGVLRSSGRWRQTGTVLTEARTGPFWHRAGSLAAAAFAFGFSDLIGDNLLTGSRDGVDGPLLHPVDLEVFLAATPRLYDTHLVHDPAMGDQHHVGLESGELWCGPEGPALCWRASEGGGLELQRRTRPFTRQASRSVVGDHLGRTGYGPHLTALLRGMFDAWTLLCRHRDEVSGFIEERRAHHYVRVIARTTSAYAEAVTSLDPAARAGFTPDERAQLERGDAPYFFRTADGGPLLVLEPSPDGFRPVPAAGAPPAESWWPPAGGTSTADRLTLAALGIALRDAVRYVFADTAHHVHDERSGVRLDLPGPRHGRVAFDWAETGRRITYTWDAATVRVGVEELSAPLAPLPPAPDTDIGRWMCALDRADAALRERWTATGFTDGALEVRLGRLVRAGIRRLRGVVERYGWPDRPLVGPAAAGAAARLLQHADDELGFRKEALELMRKSAEAGRTPWREVAGVTDSVRLSENRPQLYGTRFTRAGGVLRPFPIEDSEDLAEIDRRRAGMGLEPLRQYTARIRERFPLDAATRRPTP
ncbi:DUF4135 domain-containing protein [Streptomyces sp. NBC_01014]|uniref:DUF4135 domain-containing protein n=1 Tax=Streptomyces sp. NBC_01014 TaxID=2903719 RepID=UPI00386B73F4|nr:type 2 lanthipeptide synthetase LanM [Streptomyces sp. NBC_01014]